MSASQMVGTTIRLNNLMRYRDILQEAPLNDLSSHGDPDTEGSFRKDDLRKLQNPQWQQKVFKAFSRTPFNFNIYTYNAPDGMFDRHADSKTFRSSVNVRNLDNIYDYAGIRPLSLLTATIGKTPPDANSSINVLLLTNEGDNRLQLTPWILAHRIGHALFYESQNRPSSLRRDHMRTSIGDINNALLKLINQGWTLLRGSSDDDQASRNKPTGLEIINELSKFIAQFRSGRNGKLLNMGEFVVECVAQYLIKGEVTFNRPILDKDSRPFLSGEEKREFMALQDNNYRLHDWLYERLRNDPQFDEVRFKQRPQSSFTVYKSDGTTVHETTKSADRAEVFREMGRRVVERKPSKKAMQPWLGYIERENELKAMYQRWVDAGYFQPNATEKMDVILTALEDRMNRGFGKMLGMCIGSCLVL